MMVDRKFIYLGVFVLRCVGAATLAWRLSCFLGLCRPAWAAVAALVIAQVKLSETHRRLRDRVLGILLGIAVSLSVNVLGNRLNVPLMAQFALAVGICAAATHELPGLRVALWTCPVILLATTSSEPAIAAAMARGGEVILGALVGFGFHWAAEFLVEALNARRPANRS